jgi:hypothetical protein
LTSEFGTGRRRDDQVRVLEYGLTVVRDLESLQAVGPFEISEAGGEAAMLEAFHYRVQAEAPSRLRTDDVMSDSFPVSDVQSPAGRGQPAETVAQERLGDQCHFSSSVDFGSG